MNLIPRRVRAASAVILIGLAAGCASAPVVDWTPLATEVRRLQVEADALAKGQTSQSHLARSRELLTQAQEMLSVEKPPATVPPLHEAEAAARASLAASVMERNRHDAETARTEAAEMRRQWQDAVRLLEQTEKVAERTADGVVRSATPEPILTPLPDPPHLPGDTTLTRDAIRHTTEVWARSARELRVPVSDLIADIERTLLRLNSLEITPLQRTQILDRAAWPVLELSYRVEAEAARNQSRRAMEQAIEFSGYRDYALWSMVDLERAMKESVRDELEEERKRMADREQDLYDSLKQFEGQFATIRREARGTILSLSDILFDFDKATLRRESEFNLVKVSTILQQFPEMGIVVEGHTDNIGSQEYNLKLSERRAAAVSTFMIEQGVASERLETRAYGMSQPVASNETAEGRQSNRRVDLVIGEK